MGAGLNFFTNAVEKTAGTANVWSDIDVSGDGVPAGSTMAIVEIVNEGGSTGKAGVRKKGSSDNFTTYIEIISNGHIWAFVALDANRKFQAYAYSTTSVKYKVIGYCDSAVTAVDPPIEVTVDTSLAYTDVTLPEAAPANVVGVILRLTNEAAAKRRNFVRKKGSTDDRFSYSFIGDKCYIHAIVGVDANEQYQQKAEAIADTKAYILAYLVAPITLFTNAVDISTGTAGSWVNNDVTANTDADANGAIFAFHGKANAILKGEARKEGSSDDFYNNTQMWQYAWIPGAIGMDASQVFEQKISSTSLDLYLLGWTKDVPSGYYADGNLISDAHDIGDTTGKIFRIFWESTEPAGTTVKFQIRRAATEGGLASAPWTGPDGTAGTYYTDKTGEKVWHGDFTFRWVQWKAFLHTDDPAETPVVHSVDLTCKR